MNIQKLWILYFFVKDEGMLEQLGHGFCFEIIAKPGIKENN